MDYLIPSLPAAVSGAVGSGRFKLARLLIKELLAKPLPPGMAGRLNYETDRIERIREAYPYDRARVLKELRKALKGVTARELDGWIKTGCAVPRLVEGREKFLRSTASNIISNRPALKKRLRKKNEAALAKAKAMDARVDALLAGAAPGVSRVRARVTLTLKSAPGGKVRCWLPFPRVGDQVSSARLLAASHKKYKLAPPGAAHRTVYLEGKDKKFFAEFEYTVAESVPPVPPKLARNKVPPSARKYLAEEPPHIVFTPYVRRLAAAIAGGEKDHYKIASKIYDWLTANLTYNFVAPYGIFENISDYCLATMRGDCGFQAIAFITLCRAACVPAKWQSGWFLRKEGAGSHDWAMFYCGGWRFADLAFGTYYRVKKREARRRFYFGNLDGWRMPANSELGAPLWPAKKFWRSDPTDNQRGEVETARGNIYQDKFRSEIKVISVEQV